MHVADYVLCVTYFKMVEKKKKVKTVNKFRERRSKKLVLSNRTHTHMGIIVIKVQQKKPANIYLIDIPNGISNTHGCFIDQSDHLRFAIVNACS